MLDPHRDQVTASYGDQVLLTNTREFNEQSKDDYSFQSRSQTHLGSALSGAMT
jgi:hypothetical protein